MQTQSQTQKMDWFSVAVWVGVSFLVYTNLAMADSKLPGRRQMQILNQVQDCNIYQAVLRKAEDELKEDQERWNAVVKASAESRQALETCAKSHGITQFHTEREEAHAAALCTDQYRAWAENGYTVELAKSSKQVSKSDYERLTAFVRYQCASLTMAKNP